ncbi:hypothetical protein [Hanstruepera flava]|uniref:hypothetical protein n=1 Tax=Hanstruepera flava TaxID=2930218 RepID=UPI002028474A|nr:hypothetical protein [Hanstruepera flava]
MKNKLALLIALVVLSTYTCFSQKKVTWDDLAQVKFSEKYFPALGETFLYPEFSQAVKDLEGKEIVIIGYFLNISPAENIYILSKNPMASCFFCGVGGPETAIELQFKEKQPYETDDLIMVKGILSLNVDDVEHFNYILKNCKVEKMVPTIKS